MTGVDRNRAALTLEEAAGQLGVHYMTVYRYVRTGRLPGWKVGAEWRVAADDVGALASGGAPGPGRRPAGTGAVERSRRDADRLARRLVAGDEAGAWRIVDDALASGFAPEAAVDSLIAPALRLIGERWAAGEVDVGEEHAASALCLRILGRLGPRFARRGRTRGTVILAAPPGDAHGLPTALVADLLRGRGFGVLDLGANTPARSLGAAAAGADRLIAVGICATTRRNDDAVRSAIGAVHGSAPGTPVVLGGLAVSSERKARTLGADRWTDSSARFVETVEDLPGPVRRDPGASPRRQRPPAPH
jgi:excisionase family DNA binding protein